MTQTPRGRPPQEPPAGTLTIAQAAQQAGVSYATAYRHVKERAVRSRQADNGSIFVDARDVGKIAKHVPGLRPRGCVILQPDEPIHERWKKAAKAAGYGEAVNRWLIKLANKAAGVK